MRSVIVSFTFYQTFSRMFKYLIKSLIKLRSRFATASEVFHMKRDGWENGIF